MRAAASGYRDRPLAPGRLRLSFTAPLIRPWRLVLVVLAPLVLLAVAAGVVRGTASHQSASSPRLAAPPVSAPAPITPPGAAGLTWHTPATVVPAGTPIQQQYDEAFAQGLGSQPGMAAATTLTTPSPAVSAGWPFLPAAYTPEGWAREFVSALLDIDYANSSRPALGAWLDAQEAPEMIAGVPTSVADKTLYISLLDPGLFGGQPTPLPSDAQWTQLAAAKAHQSVDDLLIQPDPTWAQMVAQGWQPTDARLSELDVSGRLIIKRPGDTSVSRFTMQLIVGSARWHDGYGTVAVGGWQVGLS